MKNSYRGPDCVAIRFRSHQAKANTLIARGLIVAIEIGGAVVGGQEYVEIAVAVKIAIGEAAPNFGQTEIFADASLLHRETCPFRYSGKAAVAGHSPRCRECCARFRRCAHSRRQDPASHRDRRRGNMQPNPRVFREAMPTPAGSRYRRNFRLRPARYKPIISLSKFVMATPGVPELSKSATSTPMPARALPSALNAMPASTATSLNVPLRLLR